MNSLPKTNPARRLSFSLLNIKKRIRPKSQLSSREKNPSSRQQFLVTR
jgi:hypothetical protein